MGQMNDRQIRSILIAYLQSAEGEVRIFQEKEIGGSVCDLMAVTDRLTGYEIKSDRDNYKHLPSQVKAYDRFFDENYIVVGAQHEASVEYRIPPHWGIIVIRDDAVYVKRKALANKHVSRASQLHILWRLELNNLLTKTDLPLFTYKNKDYIVRQILERVSDEDIHTHLVYELMHRDYSVYDREENTADTLSASDAEDSIAKNEIVDMLSERDMEQLTLDQWIGMYSRAKEISRRKAERSRWGTAPRPPHKIPYTDIEVSPGVPEKEIAFIHSCQSEEKKVALFQRVNEGKVRILIGSTFKLGTGANVQTKLKAIHHLDVPWRPADMVQREGRILRRGNTHETIQIFRYIAEGSFDAYSWQILEAKQRFISQFLRGSASERTASDLEENVLTYAQVKALAISDARMKILCEKQNEEGRLRLLSTAFQEEHERISALLQEAEERSAYLEKRYAVSCENQRFLAGFSAERFRAAYLCIADVLTEGAIQGDDRLPEELEVCGFRVCLPPDIDRKKPAVFLERGGMQYSVKMGPSAQGNARRVLNFLKGFAACVRGISDEQQALARTAAEYRQLLTAENPYTAAIRQLHEQVVSLQREIIS